jgi:hypothetical protein
MMQASHIEEPVLFIPQDSTVASIKNRVSRLALRVTILHVFL